jgi:hypothetical protein
MPHSKQKDRTKAVQHVRITMFVEEQKVLTEIKQNYKKGKR